MYIKFIKVDIEGFLAIGKAEVDLSNQGYTLIKGINNNPDDKAHNNGSGKSTILESIVWCLTGATIRGVKDVVNMYTDTGCAVTLVLEIDGHSFQISRYKDHYKYKTNLHIIIDGEDKSGKGIRESEKLLAEYLPDLTEELIGSVVILGQGLPQRFSSNTPSGRKEVLESLTKSDFMIADLKDKLSVRKGALDTDIRQASDNMLKLSAINTVCEDNIKKDKITLNNIVSDDVLKDELVKVESDRTHASERLDELNRVVDELSEDDTKLQLELHELEQRLSENLIEFNKRKANGLSEEKSSVAEIKQRIQTCSAEIEMLESITDVCPTCGQKMPGVEKIDTTEKHRILDALKEELVAREEKLRVKEQAFVTEEITLMSQINAERRDSRKKCDERHIQLKDRMGERNECQQQLINLNNTYARIRSDLDTAKSQRDNLLAHVEQTKQIIQENNEKIVYINRELEDLNARLNAVNRMVSLATRDFRGYLLTNVIDYINKKSREYALDIFGTDKIEIILNGNNIDIKYNNKIYETLSGGERQKLDIIVQFALRDMLCQFSSFHCNILAADELLDGLDAVGVESVMRMLSTRANDLDSLFFITHRGELAFPYDKVITVQKDADGISKIIQQA